MEKFCRAGQATDGNMLHAYCILDTYGCKHILRMSNIYSSSTAKVVAPTLLNQCYVLIHCLLYYLNVIEIGL